MPIRRLTGADRRALALRHFLQLGPGRTLEAARRSAPREIGSRSLISWRRWSATGRWAQAAAEHDARSQRQPGRQSSEESHRQMLAAVKLLEDRVRSGYYEKRRAANGGLL
jgi:hypothetical protein